MGFLLAMAFIASAAALWFGLRAHDLNNAVKSLKRQNDALHRDSLQSRAERTVAQEDLRRTIRDLRKDPSNPYYEPPVTPQVARHRKSAGSSLARNTRKFREDLGVSRGDDGSTAAIVASTAAVATYSGYDSGSSYCDSGSSSFDSSCSF